MTLATLDSRCLPQVVRDVKADESFETKMAVEYVNINILGNLGISANLLHNKLEHWELKIEIEKKCIVLQILTKSMSLVNVKARDKEPEKPDELKRIQILATLALKEKPSLFVFAQLMHFMLASKMEFKDLKLSIKSRILNLSDSS